MGQLRLPLALAAMGIAALCWGWVALQRVFVEERDVALTELAARRATLVEYALRRVEEELAARLRDANAGIDAASEDPLLAADSLFFKVGGRQRLPRIEGVLDGGGTSATTLHGILLEDPTRLAIEDPESPWAERVGLLIRFREALLAGSSPSIEAAFRAILTHRTRFVISVQKDLPYWVALLEFFVNHGSPSPVLLRMLVRDGLEVPPTAFAGLQRELLQNRDRFTSEDLEFLSEQVLLLSEAAQVRSDDFALRAAERAADPLDLPEPGQIDEPYLHAPDGWMESAWYLEPDGEAATRGVKISVTEELAAISAEMRERGLLGSNDRMDWTASALLGPNLEVTQLEIQAVSPDWVTAQETIRSRYGLKTVLGLSSGVLVLCIGVLIAIVQQRHRRFLELQSDFIATVSHELRTPLASIRVQAETLQRRFSELPEARDYPARIVADIDGLSFLIDNILSFNRLSKGTWRPVRDDVSLVELASWLRGELKETTRGNVSVQLEGAEGVLLRADPELIKLLLLNLGKNACLYNRRDPILIEIRASDTAGQRLRISDNGIGIPREQWESVFQAFRRIGEMTGTRGTGLGLAICRRIMAAHGGSIRVVESSTDGTAFELVFG